MVSITLSVIIIYFLVSASPTPTPYLNIINNRATSQKDIQKAMEILNANLDNEELSEVPSLRFTKIPKDVKISAGEKVVLECEAIGVPIPVIEWSYNGDLILTADEGNTVEKLYNSGLRTVQNSVTSSKLVVPCVNAEHEGEYRCLAKNGHHKLESVATVTVEGEAKCSHKHSLPTIHMWTDGRFERYGASVQLFCRVNENSRPKITWYDERNNELSNGKKYEVLENGDLLIHDTQWEDMGGYTCIASNEHGQDQITSFFYPTKP